MVYYNVYVGKYMKSRRVLEIGIQRDVKRYKVGNCIIYNYYLYTGGLRAPKIENENQKMD